MNKKGSTLWEIINSSFFLWLLSSVVLVIVGNCYNSYTHEQDIRNEIKKLDLEIESRFSQFLITTETLVSQSNDSTITFKNDSCRSVFLKLWNEFKKPPEKNNYIFTIYQEYQNTSAVSAMGLLASRLNELGEDVNEAKENGFGNYKEFETKDLKEEIKKIKEAISFIMTRNPDEENLGSFIIELQQKIILQRWEWTYPYVDCNGGIFC